MADAANRDPWGRIVFDLDGVLCPTRWPGWSAEEAEQAEPLPGAVEATRKAKRAGYEVVIWTARPKSLEAMTRAWLDRHGFAYDDVWFEKPGYLVMVDDRALGFDGEWPGLLGRLLAFRPWWEVGEHPRTFEEALDLVLRRQRVVMVQRQRKYGSGNITASGQSGIATRMADKLERIRRELGLDVLARYGSLWAAIEAYLRGEIAPPQIEDENRGDGQIDLANYAVISYELDRGWWGLPLGEDVATGASREAEAA